MNTNELKSAIDTIEIPNGLKDSIYANILSKKDMPTNDSAVPLHRKIIKFAPIAVVASLAIIVGIHYILPVFFTDYDSADTATSSSYSEEATEEYAGGNTTEDSTEGAMPENGFDAGIEEEELDEQATLDELRISAYLYADNGNGFSEYIIHNMPLDPIIMWRELTKLGAVNSDSELIGYDYQDDNLLLLFDEKFQSEIDSNNSLLTTIVKSCLGIFPDCKTIAIMSNYTPITVNGAEFSETDFLQIADSPIEVLETYEHFYE